MIDIFFSLANLVLQDTIERIFVQDIYADIPRGIFLVRGENVLLLGEIVRFFYHPLPADDGFSATLLTRNLLRISIKMTTFPNLFAKPQQRKFMLCQDRRLKNGRDPIR